MAGRGISPGRPYDRGMGLKETVGRQLAPRITELAPGLTGGFVREALNRAIDGVGPLAPAAQAADKQLREQRGDVERAIHEVIENNVRIAGAQGFATNVGGTGHHGGDHPRQRHRARASSSAGWSPASPTCAVTTSPTRASATRSSPSCWARSRSTSWSRSASCPARPMAIATAPVHDPDLDRVISAVVATDIIARVAGKRLATTVGRQIPVVGGVVGMGADGYATWRIGRYADREMLPRRR